MYHKTKEFQKLKSQWYKKLEKDGFVDAEQDEYALKDWHSFKFKRDNADGQKHVPTEVYYREAGKFLYDHDFDCDRSRLIWELHCNGVTTWDSVPKLLARGYAFDKSAVHVTVQALAKIMLKKINE